MDTVTTVHSIPAIRHQCTWRTICVLHITHLTISCNPSINYTLSPFTGKTRAHQTVPTRAPLPWQRTLNNAPRRSPRRPQPAGDSERRCHGDQQRGSVAARCSVAGVRRTGQDARLVRVGVSRAVDPLAVVSEVSRGAKAFCAKLACGQREKRSADAEVEREVRGLTNDGRASGGSCQFPNEQTIQHHLLKTDRQTDLYTCRETCFQLAEGMVALTDSIAY